MRPETWSSHYNLGNFYAGIKEVEKAIASYETALRLELRAVLPLTNIAMRRDPLIPARMAFFGQDRRPDPKSRLVGDHSPHLAFDLAAC